MKLRDSFISLKHISNELNIPLNNYRGEAIASEIIPSDYESGTDKEKESKSLPCSTIADTNIKMIDKQSKTTGTRVRNLKKSMLNDNKLIKLRNKLLRRSKSTVGISTKSTTIDTERSTKEESQNKENELPKHMNKFNTMIVKKSNFDIEPPPTSTSPVKLMSPNRNRVKMGTRVFSSQFLNKSFDNIFNTSVDVYRFDDEMNEDGNHRMYSVHPSASSSRRSHREQYSHTARSSPNSIKTCDEAIQSGEDGLSLKSTSLSSLYFSEKMSEKYSESPFPSEAYVIRK